MEQQLDLKVDLQRILRWIGDLQDVALAVGGIDAKGVVLLGDEGAEPPLDFESAVEEVSRFVGRHARVGGPQRAFVGQRSRWRGRPDHSRCYERPRDFRNATSFSPSSKL